MQCNVMLCYVMLRMHGCMYKDVCMYLSHRCICTCVCARACVCVCLSRMCMRMFMEKGGGLGGNGCGEERHMQKVTTMLINEPVDPLTGTLNGVPPPRSRKMSQKRPDLGYRGVHTHTLSLSLSVCLSICLSVCLSLSLLVEVLGAPAAAAAAAVISALHLFIPNQVRCQVKIGWCVSHINGTVIQVTQLHFSLGALRIYLLGALL